MHKCPDCGVETRHIWINKFDGTSEEGGMCPRCFRITVEGDFPLEQAYQQIRDENTLDEGGLG